MSAWISPVGVLSSTLGLFFLAAAIAQLALVAWVSCHSWHDVRPATLIAPVVTTSLLIAVGCLTLP